MTDCAKSTTEEGEYTRCNMCNNNIGPYFLNPMKPDQKMKAVRKSARQAHREFGGPTGCQHPASKNMLKKRQSDQGFAAQGATITLTLTLILTLPLPLTRAGCTQRREQAAWQGQQRTFYNCVVAEELHFSEDSPYGVIAPAGPAVSSIGDSLRVARGVLKGDELYQLQEELAGQPRSLSWGSASDPKMAKSKRKFFELEQTAHESLLQGVNKIRSRRALNMDLAQVFPRKVCTSELAQRVAAHVGFEDNLPLRGMQVNYQHTDYPKVCYNSSSSSSRGGSSC